MKLYAVFVCPIPSQPHGGFVGVYSDSALAESKCRDCRFLVIPTELNETHDSLPEQIPGKYRPNQAAPGAVAP